MSAFTDRLYRAWTAQNGYTGPRHRPNGGIGGVAPDAEPQHGSANPPDRVQPSEPAQVPAARPESLS